MSEQALAKNGHEALSGVPFEQDTLRLAKAMAASGFFKDSQNVAQAAVKILAGRELGVGAVAAMTGIFIVDGKVVLSANLMAAVVKRSGRYNYRVRTLTIEACAIEFFEGKESVGVSEFTMDDAKTAGLAGRGTWRQYPRNLLFARAMSNGCRFFCADVFGGPAYTPEELGASVDEDGSPVEVQQEPTPIPPPKNPQTVVVDVATPAQVRAIYLIARDQHGLADEEIDEKSRSLYGSFPAELTKAQATVFISALKGGEEPPAGTKVSDRAGEFAAEYADVLGEPIVSDPEPLHIDAPESPLRAEAKAILERMRRINPQTKVTLPADDAPDATWNLFIDEFAAKVEAAERPGARRLEARPVSAVRAWLTDAPTEGS